VPRSSWRRLAGAVAVALALAFVISLASGTGARTATGRLGGDYPAFYAAGRLVTSSQRHDMYDASVQATSQAGLFAEPTNDGVLYFAYPPHAALLYAPLSHLPYRMSYAVHTLLMVGAALAALALIRPLLPAIYTDFAVVAVAAVSFYPLYRAITGGQNTALTLLLLAGSWRAVHDRNDLTAGVLLGLLMFKPQFAVPLLALHLIARRGKVVMAAAVTTLVCYAIDVALLGPVWLTRWLDSVRAFTRLDAQVNRRNAISFIGATDTLFGVGNSAGRAVGGLLAAATAAVLAWMWWRGERAALAWPMPAAFAGVVLISPHAMFYDAGLLIVPILALVASGERRAARAAIVLWVAAFLDVFKGALGLTPLFAVTVATFVVIVAASRLLPAAPNHNLLTEARA
jgi:hypothetical protein